jgi:hypothetical protein
MNWCERMGGRELEAWRVFGLELIRSGAGFHRRRRGRGTHHHSFTHSLTHSLTRFYVSLGAGKGIWGKCMEVFEEVSRMMFLIFVMNIFVPFISHPLNHVSLNA